MAKPWAIVLNGGGLRSLVATAIAAESARLALIYIHDGRPSDACCCRAFSRQAKRYEAARALEISLPHLAATAVWAADDQSAKRQPLTAMQRLTAAAAAAVQLKAEKLVWPVQVGQGFADVAQVLESIVLLQHMVQLNDDLDLVIDTPLLEMTDSQVIEIGHQMDVPWELSHSCGAAGAEPCGECRGCHRRTEAFAKAGIENPLTAAASRA